MPRAVSVLVGAVILVGIALAASILYAYLSTSMLKASEPKVLLPLRISSVSVGLKNISSVSYDFEVYIYMVNPGTKSYTLANGYAVFLVTGTNAGGIKTCYIEDLPVNLKPGVVTRIDATCTFTDDEMQKYFGTTIPSSNIVQSSLHLLFVKATIAVGGGGGGGYPGGEYLIT